MKITKQKQNDFLGYLNHYTRVILLTLYKSVYTFISFTSARMKNIKIATNCKFIGLTHFYRKPYSTIQIGSNCKFNSIASSNLIGINRKCMISTLTQNAKLEIGNDCGFSGTVIGTFDSIILGNNVRCGANTLITDSDWHLDDIRSSKPKPIKIEDNVWLGEGVKVLKGVVIGQNSVIGAGSIVTKDIPANVIAAGNPCRVIKSIDNE